MIKQFQKWRRQNRLLSDLSKQYKAGQTNKCLYFEIDQTDNSLYFTDIEELIQNGFLYLDEEKGKHITLDGNWKFHCRLTHKTNLFIYYTFCNNIWRIFNFIGGVGGCVALVQMFL